MKERKRCGLILVIVWVLLIYNHVNQVMAPIDTEHVLFENQVPTPFTGNDTATLIGWQTLYSGLTYSWEFDIQKYKSVDLSTSTSWHIVVMVKFTEEFKEVYQYEDSRGYNFALKVFVGDPSNGWYLNTIRLENGWVGNAPNHWLTWAVPAYKYKDGVVFHIPLSTISVATKEYQEGYQYRNRDLSKYFGTNQVVWFYLSSTKEVKGWELAEVYATVFVE